MSLVVFAKKVLISRRMKIEFNILKASEQSVVTFYQEYIILKNWFNWENSKVSAYADNFDIGIDTVWWQPASRFTAIIKPNLSKSEDFTVKLTGTVGLILIYIIFLLRLLDFFILFLFLFCFVYFFICFLLFFSFFILFFFLLLDSLKISLKC